MILSETLDIELPSRLPKLATLQSPAILILYDCTLIHLILLALLTRFASLRNLLLATAQSNESIGENYAVNCK